LVGCRNNKKVQQITKENPTKNTSDGDFSVIDSIIKVQSIEKAWWHEVQINNYKVKLKFDTRAEVNLIPYKVFNNIKN